MRALNTKDADLISRGKQIREFRKKKELTVRELAKQAGISQGFLSKIENGTGHPNEGIMQNICNVLEISPADLLDTQPESSEPPVASVSSNGSFLLKREDRRPIYCMGDGFRMEALLEENRYDARIKVMTINGVFQERMTSAHRYDSFGIVASGKLGIKLADGTYFEVSEGECIMVRAEIEHVTRCLSEQPCVSYWIDLAPKKYTEEEAMNRIVQDDAGRIYEIRPIR